MALKLGTKLGSDVPSKTQSLEIIDERDWGSFRGVRLMIDFLSVPRVFT
jgi:hypothetical protein